MAKTHLKIPFVSELDENFRIDGNCVLYDPSKVEFLGQTHLELSACRNAHRLVFRLVNTDGMTLSFTNVHLHHQLEPVDDIIRLDQLRATIEWITELDAMDQVHYSVLAGDFNFSATSVAYSYATETAGFTSCFAYNNGQEPTKTFPTGLQAATMDTDPALTCDYIFVKPVVAMVATDNAPNRLQPTATYLFGNEPAMHDSTLYPSDHIGICALFEAVCK